jgi:hypothetical protein
MLSPSSLATWHHNAGRERDNEMHLVVSTDNEAMLAWLDGALRQAFTQGKMVLVAYLEAVMEEVLFEMEINQYYRV